MQLSHWSSPPISVYTYVTTNISSRVEPRDKRAKNALIIQVFLPQKHIDHFYFLTVTCHLACFAIFQERAYVIMYTEYKVHQQIVDRIMAAQLPILVLSRISSLHHFIHAYV